MSEVIHAHLEPTGESAPSGMEVVEAHPLSIEWFSPQIESAEASVYARECLEAHDDIDPVRIATLTNSRRLRLIENQCANGLRFCTIQDVQENQHIVAPTDNDLSEWIYFDGLGGEHVTSAALYTPFITRNGWFFEHFHRLVHNGVPVFETSYSKQVNAITGQVFGGTYDVRMPETGVTGCFQYTHPGLQFNETFTRVYDYKQQGYETTMSVQNKTTGISATIHNGCIIRVSIWDISLPDIPGYTKIKEFKIAPSWEPRHDVYIFNGDELATPFASLIVSDLFGYDRLVPVRSIFVDEVGTIVNAVSMLDHDTISQIPTMTMVEETDTGIGEIDPALMFSLMRINITDTSCTDLPQ